MDSEHSITYSLTRTDFKVYAKRVLALSKARQPFNAKVLFWIRWFGMLLVFAVLMQILPGGIPSESLPHVLLFTLLMLALLISMVLRNARLMQPDKRGYVLGERTLSFDDSGIDVKGLHHREHLDWEIVTEVDETKDHLFIFIDTSAAHIIPRRIFESPEACKRFSEALQAYRA